MKRDCACGLCEPCGLCGLSAHCIDLRQKPKDLQAWNSCKSESLKLQNPKEFNWVLKFRIALRTWNCAKNIWNCDETRKQHRTLISRRKQFSICWAENPGSLRKSEKSWRRGFPRLRRSTKNPILRLQFRVCCEGRKQPNLQLESRGEKHKRETTWNLEKPWETLKAPWVKKLWCPKPGNFSLARQQYQ